MLTNMTMVNMLPQVLDTDEEQTTMHAGTISESHWYRRKGQGTDSYEKLIDRYRQ